MAQLEAQLEAFFRERVRMAGGYTIKLAPMEAGVPDRLAIFPWERMYLVELKAVGGQLSPVQKIWHERVLDRYGLQVHVLHGKLQVIHFVRSVVRTAAGEPVDSSDDD